MTRTALCSLLVVGCGSLDASMTTQGSRLSQSALCQGADAKKAFGAAAICVCEDLDLVGAGLLARSVGAPADVGVNGLSHVVGRHEIGGSLVAMRGITGVGEVETFGGAATEGDVSGVGHVKVGGDLMVGGRLSNVGLLDVAGTLGVAGEAGFVGQSAVQARGAYVAPAEPCGCGTLAVDAAQKVADARGRAAALGAVSSVGVHAQTLGTGEYFIESLASVGRLELTIDGAAAVYLGGSLEAVGDQRITLTPGSTLDLYVEQGLSTVGASLFGAGASPGSVRIFLGGSGRQSAAVGAQTFNASIYAPRAELSLVGDTHVVGAIFAKSISGVGLLTVDYSGPTGAAPEVCVDEGDPAPGAGAGSGSGTNGGPFIPL